MAISRCWLSLGLAWANWKLRCERTQNIRGPTDLRNGGSLPGCGAGLHLLPRGHWPGSSGGSRAGRAVTWPGLARRTNDSRDTPSGTGCVCASEEELPARNFIRTFRFDVLSPGVAEDKVLPRMIAWRQPLRACPRSWTLPAGATWLWGLGKEARWEGAVGASVGNQGASLSETFPHWSWGCFPHSSLLTEGTLMELLCVRDRHLWSLNPRRGHFKGGRGKEKRKKRLQWRSAGLRDTFKLKNGLLDLIRAG